MTPKTYPNRLGETSWTAEEDDTMRASLAAGDSAGVCGKKIGKSRSAVIGRARRLGLTLGGAPSREKQLSLSAGRKLAWETRRANAPIVKKQHEGQRITAKLQMAGVSNGGKAPYTPKPDEVASPNRVTIVDLKHSHCRSVDDDGWYCGNPKSDGSSYCVGHRARFTYPMPDRKRSDRQSSYLAKNF